MGTRRSKHNKGVKPPANPPFFEADEHKWHEYNAKFTDGKLVAIEMVSPLPTLSA